MLIDTHCHLNFIAKKTFDTPLEQSAKDKLQNIISDAKEHDVTTIISVGTSVIESRNSIEIAKWFDQTFSTVGIHPNDATLSWKKDFEQIKKMVDKKEENKIVGIGECGLDRHWPGYNLPRQIDLFKYHIDLAIENDLPLIIHCRDARDEMFKCLEEFSKNARGILHCFCQDIELAKEVIKMGYYLGIGGPITYPKNEQLRETIKKVGLDCLVLESDAPFLPPQIIRGKSNAPMYVQNVAQYIAELFDQPLENVANITTNNAKKIFGL
ncbi:TatD family hydrolase [bacterium]|jgi:TatD DNase family protein|nr:TatD family hydrolase [bacterium]